MPEKLSIHSEYKVYRPGVNDIPVTTLNVCTEIPSRNTCCESAAGKSIRDGTEISYDILNLAGSTLFIFSRKIETIGGFFPTHAVVTGFPESAQRSGFQCFGIRSEGGYVYVDLDGSIIVFVGVNLVFRAGCSSNKNCSGKEDRVNLFHNSCRLKVYHSSSESMAATMPSNLSSITSVSGDK